MLRCLIVPATLWLAASGGLLGAIWPEQFAQSKRVSAKPIAVTDQPVWAEYGLEEAEEASYTGPHGAFRAMAWRLKDPTSALAAAQWLQPLQTLQKGNYLFAFENYKITAQDLQALLNVIPRLDQSPLPTLPDLLPPANRIRGSERFVIGPIGLEKFEPRIPPSVAAFHLGAEAQLARFQSTNGELNLAIFSYPTPHIARERVAEFQKLPGAMVKRSGPIVAVSLNPPNADEAERLLSQVNYKATITWNEATKPVNQAAQVGEMLLSIFTVAGILILLCVIGGALVAGVRILSRRGTEEDPMILLHLDDKHTL